MLQLKCGHVFHAHCVKDKLKALWPAARISFGFLECPACRAEIEHPALADALAPHLALRAEIARRAGERLKIDGMDKDKRLTNPADHYYGKPALFADKLYAYYPCFKCHKPYFGGRRSCDVNAADEAASKEDMVCFECAGVRTVVCGKPEHAEHAVWKCRYCCDLAVWFCFGTTHFCESCHNGWIAGKISAKTTPASVASKCSGGHGCKLKLESHPPNGGDEELCIGCAVCTEKMQERATT